MKHMGPYNNLPRYQGLAPDLIRRREELQLSPLTTGHVASVRELCRIIDEIKAENARLRQLVSAPLPLPPLLG